jgi:hypothetical protein
LSLLVTRILFVDHVQLAFAAYDLAIFAALFDGCSYFHFFKLLAIGLQPLAMETLFLFLVANS